MNSKNIDFRDRNTDFSMKETEAVSLGFKDKVSTKNIKIESPGSIKTNLSTSKSTGSRENT